MSAVTTKGRTSFVSTERERQAGWKASTTSLPDAAKVDAAYSRNPEGPAYPFCLPTRFADHNLLPVVREPALRLFEELEIRWHDGVSGGPSNHLLSSQVQCVNALGQMVTDASRIKRAFGGVLDIEEVLEIEPGRKLTFEFIGDCDYFGEGAGKARRRGSNCTSVDAAFRYRTSHGIVELALVEWKYTESYPAVRDHAIKAATRRARYLADYLDEAGPIEPLLEFDLIQDEPFYQLVRQQLLARRLELDPNEPAEAVRVVHVLDARNLAYQASLVRAEHRELGATVGEAWQRMLRTSDRFVHLDPAVFLDEAVTCEEYVVRYGSAAVKGRD